MEVRGGGEGGGCNGRVWQNELREETVHRTDVRAGRGGGQWMSSEGHRCFGWEWRERVMAALLRLLRES